MKKISFISSPGLENFMLPVANGLEKRGYGVKIVAEPNDQAIIDAVIWSDTVWIEWGNELAMHITTDAGLLNGRNVILRIHSYEAFLPYIKYINFERVDCLIFVAQHINDIVLDQVPKIEKMVEDIRIIPNGVDMDAIPFKERSPGNNIAYIGYINHKKGPMLLMQAFVHLSKSNPELTLHIAGTFQEPRYELYFKQFLEHTGLTDKVTFYGHVDNIPAWLDDKHFILSTSVLESQGMGIMEAMAAGVKPLVHNFYGAENVYDESHLWTTFDELDECLDLYDSEMYREYVDVNYSLNDTIVYLESVIADLPSKTVIQTPTEQTKDLKPVTLTVAMMVKDEEKNLKRCLDSVKDFADEIVIVDTGSTDSTPSIARRYTDKIYRHPWENFSVHRNQSVGYSTMDWIFQIDADEEFVGDGEDLKKALAAVQGNCDAMTLMLDDLRATDDISVKQRPARLFKNGTVHYVGSVHNEPMFDRKRAAFWSDGHINHYGYHGDPDLKKKKSARTIGLLEKELIDNPSRTKVLFYLFQSYCDIGQIDKGVEHGWKYLAKRNESHDFNESIYFSLISVYLSKKDYATAKGLLDEALLIIPNDVDVATAMVELGVATNDGNMLLEGVKKYTTAFAYMLKNPTSTGIRFTYSFRKDSLAYVLHRAAMTHLENGKNHTKELMKAVAGLEPGTRDSVLKEFNKNLEILGITIKE